MENDVILNIEEAAKYMKLSTASVYKLCTIRELPGVKVGNSWRFHKKLLEDWLIERMISNTKEHNTQSPTDKDISTTNSDELNIKV